MAYAALVSLINTLEQHSNQNLFLNHQKQQHQALQEKATVLLEFLEKSSQYSRNVVEAKIREAAYEAEDVVESQMLDQSDPINCSRGHQDLEKVIAELNSVLQEVRRTKGSYREEDDQKPRNSLRPVPSGPALGHQNIMVGSDDNLKKIKNRLLGSNSELEVISIIGMGGIGKTTLATTLYNDPVTQSHFPTRGWVTVSQTYSVPQLLRDILESMNMLTDQMRQEDDVARLAEHLYRMLMKSARYLVVLDDVWDTNVWDSIGRIFPKGNNGSRIIITSRLKQIAHDASSNSSPHQMQLMSEEEGWNLLRQKVFGEKYCPLELEESGRKIAKCCKGLPLAIVVTGGLLSKLRVDPNEWEIFADRLVNSISTLNVDDDDDDDQCLEILSLSYNHLPPHLKACFLYMGAFPEDDEISVSRLIKLWLAEGFLKEETSRNLVEVAEENFEELVGRNLILVCEKRFNGKIRTCRIHDQLRRLCLKEARKDNFLGWDDQYRRQVPNRIRRVSFRSFELITNPTEFPFSRSIFCTHFRYGYLEHFAKFVSCFKLLRVLDLGQLRLDEFPVFILELIHLRYLWFCCRGELPTSISKLINLQTLIIDPSSQDLMFLFNFEIWKMPWLRYVHGVIIQNFSYPIGPRSGPKNLQGLSWIESSLCTKENLQEFPNLRKLGIWAWGHTWNKEALCINNLSCLEQLEELKCEVDCWSGIPRTSFYEKLVFPKTLKKLTLTCTYFSWEQMRILASLPDLQVLKLKHRACECAVWDTSECEFTQLKVLLIGTRNLREWRAESANFPNLQHLILNCCRELLGIPNGIGDIPTLETIELNLCSKSCMASAAKIQQEQDELGNNLQLLISWSWGKRFRY